MNIRTTLTLAAMAAGALAASAQDVPAFPGAEGHARYITGGRGGAVYHVTTLEDNAADESVVTGSLRWALSKSGPKTIVFDVSGTIDLKQKLKTGKDNLTIAGQTSPGGICLSGFDFVINSSNVILRYMRFRPGDHSLTEVDGLGGMDKSDIMVDHCSVSWSVDECLSVYGMTNSTVQWCIASEALRVSVHGKGTHCYGGNWGGTDASYHHNLIAHCESRTPRLGPRYTTQTDELVDIRNNVFYNWAGEGCYGGEAQKVNIVANYYKPGPATRYGSTGTSAVRYRIAKIGVRTTEYVTKYPDYAPTEHVWGRFFIDSNVMSDNDEVTADNWTKGVYAQQTNGSHVDNLWTDEVMQEIRLTEPLDAGEVTTHTAAEAYDLVLQLAGASLYRDEVDDRIVSDVTTDTASFRATGNSPGYINTPSDTRTADEADNDEWSAWPALAFDATRSVTDTDGDGIPDAWETANGLNPNSATDGKAVCADGYTNLEHYLNSLVAHITAAQQLTTQGSAIDEARCPAAAISVSNGRLTLSGLEAAARVSIHSLSGSRQAQATVSGQATFDLPRGIAVVHLVFDGGATRTFKVRI